MNRKIFFISGIGTNVGKTIISAILTEAWKADYWKPIQSGDLHYSDTMKTKELVSNNISKFHNEKFKLTEPLSPHASAKIDKVKISIHDFQLPNTNNHLIVEGAGGLMVPLNHEGDLIIDLIKHLNIPVILVSQNYLGSINHTLLSIKELQNQKIPIEGIIFNGETNTETEAIIEKISGVKTLCKIPPLKELDKKSIAQIIEQTNYLNQN
jgi:dethiobiotin synthetase